MTDDEAKTKLCCGAPAIARSNQGELDTMCRGSACMAWRWNMGSAATSDEPDGSCGLTTAPQTHAA